MVLNHSAALPARALLAPSPAGADGAAGSIDDVLNRVSTVRDADNSDVAEFQYLGAGTPSVFTYPQPNLERRWQKKAPAGALPPCVPEGES